MAQGAQKRLIPTQGLGLVVVIHNAHFETKFSQRLPSSKIQTEKGIADISEKQQGDFDDTEMSDKIPIGFRGNKLQILMHKQKITEYQPLTNTRNHSQVEQKGPGPLALVGKDDRNGWCWHTLRIGKFTTSLNILSRY